MSCLVDQLAADRRERRPRGLFGSRRTRARRPATRSARAARSTALGRSSEPDVAASRAWAGELPGRVGRRVLGVDQRVASLAEVALFGIRLDWVVRTARHSAASLVQVPTGSALRGCAPAAPVDVRVHRAIPDRRRGSETYRKGTWAFTTGADSGVRPCRRAFDIETAETTDTDRVLPRFSFPDFPSPRGTPSCPLNCEAHASNAAAA
jgi:hypothetical protein